MYFETDLNILKNMTMKCMSSLKHDAHADIKF